MCGRFTLSERLEQLQKRYEIHEITYDHQPSYNIAPTDPITTVQINSTGSKFFQQLSWGIPLKIEALNNLVINVRDDSISKNNFFSKMFNNNRCLIPASGFYEWQKAGSSKVPYYIKSNQKIISFAGLYYKIKDIFYTAIITTNANEVVSKLHDRMPVMIPQTQEDFWLTSTAVDDLQSLLTPYPADLTSYYKVSTKVNSVKNDSPDLIKPKTTSSLTDFF